MLETNELTVAEILRNARTNGRRKREISTLSRLLCIKEDFLTAIENGDYGKIPERVYLLGFVRNYAIELGLDPDVIIKKLKQEIDNSEKENKEDLINEECDNLCNKSEKSFFSKYWQWILLLFITIIVIISTVLIIHKNKNSNIDSDTEELVENIYNEPEYNIPVREKFGMEYREESKIILQSVSDSGSWIQIKDSNGYILFSKALVKGDIYYVPNKPNLKAVFGNVQGVDVWINNKSYKLGLTNTRKSDINLSVESLIEIAVK